MKKYFFGIFRGLFEPDKIAKSKKIIHETRCRVHQHLRAQGTGNLANWDRGQPIYSSLQNITFNSFRLVLVFWRLLHRGFLFLSCSKNRSCGENVFLALTFVFVSNTLCLRLLHMFANSHFTNSVFFFHLLFQKVLLST